jgi:hypothetical protein
MAGQGLALAVNYKLATLNYPYFKELAPFYTSSGKSFVSGKQNRTNFLNFTLLAPLRRDDIGAKLG